MNPSMEDKLEIAKEILKKYNQEHLLHFYDELSKDEKNRLLDQILTINFEKILTVYKQSLNFRYDPNVKVSPIPHIEKDKLSKRQILALHTGKIACCRSFGACAGFRI